MAASSSVDSDFCWTWSPTTSTEDTTHTLFENLGAEVIGTQPALSPRRFVLVLDTPDTAELQKRPSRTTADHVATIAANECVACERPLDSEIDERVEEDVEYGKRPSKKKIPFRVYHRD